MTGHAVAEAVLFLAVLTGLAVPLGAYMARVFSGESSWARWLERPIYRLAGVIEASEMRWTQYAAALLAFNLLGGIIVYVLQRLQDALPLNPAAIGAVSPEVSFNTAVSFATNTNWQAYGGESTLSYLTQMLALTVQNFVSAAAGIAVLLALVRGFVRRETENVGNFWVDLVKATVYVLLPLSLLFALAFVSQGVVQTVGAYVKAATLQDGAEQLIAVGPAASQIAIKQLGTNGGGFFNVNSTHPFENPTPLSNFLQVLAIVLIPAALCFTFGALVKDKRQGHALYAAMLVIFVPLMFAAVYAEHNAPPALCQEGVDASAGNLEGKEVRFGVTSSAIWAVATTAASNGSVNAMHDSFTPLGGLIPMWLMQLGEVVFGGVGSGLYGLLMYAVLAVFIAGLMVGRTPEYLGKKIEAKEMKMAVLAILLPSATVLVGTALACMLPEAAGAVANPGAHGFSEILYAFSSGANNNGSAFGGLTVNGVFYATAIGITMLIGRYWVIVPVLALAGSLAKKKYVPPSAGTLPTHTMMFVGLLVGTLLLLGALTFLPALALGPIVEHVQMIGGER